MTTATATRTSHLRLPAALFRSFLSAIVADRALPESVELLRQAGYDAGAEIHALLEEELERAEVPGSIDSLPTPRFWSGFTAFWESLGWGTLEHRQDHPGVAELTSLDWAEAEAAPAGLGCQLTTGVLADVLSRVASQDVALIEVECRGRGESRCRFLVGAPVALAALHRQLHDGRSPDDALARLG